MLICCAMWRRRTEKNPKGTKNAATMVIISVHLTMTYRDNPTGTCLSTFLVVFPHFCTSPWQRAPCWKCLCSFSGKEWWGVAEVHGTISKCKQSHSWLLSSIRLCLRIWLAFFFPLTSPQKYSPTRTLTHKFISDSIPSSQFTLSFSCLITAEDCGTQSWWRGEKKNRYWKSRYWPGSLSSPNPSWPWGGIERSLSAQQGPLSLCLSLSHTHTLTHTHFLSPNVFQFHSLNSVLHKNILFILIHSLSLPTLVSVTHRHRHRHTHTHTIRLISSIVTRSGNESLHAITSCHMYQNLLHAYVLCL